MKLVSMERTQKNESKPMDMSCDEKYPYGLRIHLGTEELKKLGIQMPAIGQEFSVMAKAVVCDTHESQSLDGHEHKSVGLQITELAVKTGKEKSDSDVIYGDKK